MDIHISKAAPLRVTPGLVWLIEYGAGGRDLLMTSVDMSVTEVVRMISNQTHDDFTVCNVTVGQFALVRYEDVPEHLRDNFQSYHNDARKVDRDGMVIV